VPDVCCSEEHRSTGTPSTDRMLEPAGRSVANEVALVADGHSNT
jgi:hypothetical protein